MVKLGLTAACVVFFIMFIVSLPWAFIAEGKSQTFVAGSRRISWFRLGKADAPLFAGTGTQPTRTGIHWNKSWWPAWGVSVEWLGPQRQLSWVQIPIWLPLLLVGIPAALLWWSERWPSMDARCAHCGYDLTGNVSGRCSECGEKV